jgi:hypothetical protein
MRFPWSRSRGSSVYFKCLIRSRGKKKGSLNVDLNEISMNMVPFPKLKYLMSSVNPFIYLFISSRIKCTRINVCVCMYVCVCACVRAHTRTHTRTHTHKYAGESTVSPTCTRRRWYLFFCRRHVFRGIAQGAYLSPSLSLNV